MGLLDLILDENRMLLDGVKHQLTVNNFNTVIESIFSIGRNEKEAEFVCQTDDYIQCMDYFNETNDEMHYKLINMLQEKCTDTSEI